MSQQDIPPTGLEYCGEHRGYRMYRCSDGTYEARLSTAHTQVATRVKKDRHGREYEEPVFKPTKSDRRVLPVTSYDEACAMIDLLFIKKENPKYDPNSTGSLF